MAFREARAAFRRLASRVGIEVGRGSTKAHTAQISEGIHGVKYTTWNTRCIPWCIPVFGVFLPLFGVFRPGIHQTPPFGVFRMVYSQSNSTYTRHFRPKMMPQCTHLIWRLLQMPQGGPTGSGCWGSSAPAAPAAAAVPMWCGSRQCLPVPMRRHQAQPEGLWGISNGVFLSPWEI